MDLEDILAAVGVGSPGNAWEGRETEGAGVQDDLCRMIVGDSEVSSNGSSASVSTLGLDSHVSACIFLVRTTEKETSHGFRPWWVIEESVEVISVLSSS